MPNSMTAYGLARCQNEDYNLELELRSVNHRFLELQFRLPRNLQALEMPLRERLSAELSRGKVEVRLSVEDKRPSANKLRLDEALVLAYASAFRELAELLGEEAHNLLPLIWRQEGILQREEEKGCSESLLALLQETLTAALVSFHSMRRKEAATLVMDLEQKLQALETERLAVLARADLVPALQRERLSKRLADILQEERPEYYPEQRLAAEIAIFADKADIQEELQRLNSHIKQFGELLQERQDPVGKAMDFLLQEMLREINTMGSKANDLIITQHVLQQKKLVEQIREQIQNLE